MLLIEQAQHRRRDQDFVIRVGGDKQDLRLDELVSERQVRRGVPEE